MSPSRRILVSVALFIVLACGTAVVLSGLGSLLFRDWTLTFLRSWNSPGFWGVLLLGAGCFAAIAVLFQDEQRLVTPQLGYQLLGLRCVLVLILVLALLQPVWVWSSSRRERPRVLLALDLSESMDTIDLQATTAEKVRWAQAIGMFGSDSARALSDGWIASFTAGKEPVWVLEQEESNAARREQLARARQQNLDTLLRDLGEYSRLELLQRSLMVPSNSVLKELQQWADIQLAGFAQKCVPLSDEDIASIDALKSQTVGRDHSRLEQAIADTQAGADRKPLAGVVLLSDGHDTDPERATELLSRMKGLGVPVHTVLVGSEHRPRDISILHVDSPETVFVQDQPRIKATLQRSGFEGDSIVVYLDDLDNPEAVPMERVLEPNASSEEVEFVLPELSMGRHRYRIRTDVAANETREDNNTHEFVLTVIDDRARVLLIDGESRWETRFLAAALSRDERVSVDQVLFEQPYLRVLDKPFFPRSIEELNPPASNSTPFATYDVVIVGDVSPQHLNPLHWQQLDRYVRQEGGTLVLTAGKRFFPKSYHGTLAETLLPVEGIREIRSNVAADVGPPTARGFRLSITPDGEQLPIFQLNADPAASQRLWQNLAGHFWGLAGTAHGGASVWATVAHPQRGDNAGKSGLAEERENALIAQHYLGSGQVVWIGIDSTWRWRYLVGDEIHHRFWGQLVRWAVRMRSSAGSDLVRVGVAETSLKEGETATIQARWNPGFLAEHPGMNATVEIEQQSVPRPVRQQIELTPEEGNVRLFSGRTSPLPAGEYRVRLKVDGAEMESELPEFTFHVNADLSRERQDVSANKGLMEKIAEVTGGRFLYLNELHSLTDLFQDQTPATSLRQEIPLYSHWIILVLFSAAAMAEWVLRKLYGLP